MINPLFKPAYVDSALVTDVPVMDRLEQQAFNTPWSRELLQGAILNSEYIVRVARNHEPDLVGFYIAHGVEERCNLDNLVVAPEHRNQGHGTVLIRDWITKARQRGLGRLTLQVNTANRDAQRLYERLGFSTTRLLVSYYPNGDDAYLMVREAPPGNSIPPEPEQPLDWVNQLPRRKPRRK